jgi:methylmalonyl-CoA mutase N-terminal domain/subunit
VERAGERQPSFTNSSEVETQPLYTEADLADWRPAEALGFPGEFPYTRGAQPTMYRGRLWTMRQYAGYATAEESNRRYRYLLDQGGSGLSVAFDLPTQMGYDADHTLAEGEVGKVGVSISSLEDMRVLFDGIPLERITTSMTINATAAILLSLYIAVAREQGADVRKLSGTVQNDILKEYIARGTYIYPPKPSMRIITDLFRYCADEVPRWNTISISGYHIREAGATAAQEIGFTLANGIAYVQAAIDAGLDVDGFAGQLSFFFNSHNLFFEEVAKFRAARRMWAHIMRERFHAKDARSLLLRFHTQTAGSTLTAQQPDNNVMRTAYQAMAAALGGTQSLHTNAKDEACWPMRRASPIPSIRWPAPTMSRRSRMIWSASPGSTSRRSTRSAAACAPLSRATSSAKSRRRHTATSVTWMKSGASSSASTSSRRLSRSCRRS